MPNDTDMESAGNTAVAGYNRAEDELGRAYESVVTALTMEKRISQARAVRDEMLQLFKSAPAPALVPKPAAHNVEGVWRWGKHAMVFYSNGTAKEFFPDKGSSPLGGRWKAANEKEVSLQLDNGYVVACALSSGGSMVASCRSPDGRRHEVLAKPIAKSSTLWRWFNGVFVELGADGCVNGDPKCR